MVSHDVIAQLRQDITTAENAGDQAATDRLRAELSDAIDALDNTDSGDENAGGLAGTGAAPQPSEAPRRAAADLGPGSYDGTDDLPANIPGAVPEDAQEPPD
ncbi:hypothetical protein NBRGN_020_00040 [Nocardia brasiliensis NBRC 14402]|uniref:hypothetical protein n=1 Tax=Nocardia brasiliensis TaxID=37326 RepID=UPI0002E14D43|nr:hypothetical protein [Nocardia brasiliensis]ASF08254.1 hypothetical protein CEQ30_13850 [Nocardia brasiliensis]GAJ79921.1 hypothetical protein NBRGN_020_00040 [Nocardia brasiliensis NBRC 14402]SUB41296.1 Uncharacterised protein [Nocardia brasiliensis]